MRPACAVFLMVAFAQAFDALAQQPPGFTERVEVTRILVDARVLDSRGQPIRHLGPSDFIVKIGGKAARVESALWVSGAPAGTPPLDSAEFRVSDKPPEGRLIVFVFQKSLEASRIVGLMRMLIEARAWLDALAPTDRVAVLSFDSRLQVWLDFTNDTQRIRRVFERGILFEQAAGVQESPWPSLVRRLDPRRARRTYSIEGALTRVGEALEDLPGAKSIVLVGHGFGDFGRNGVSMTREYGPMRTVLQAARASVFCLDVTDADYHSLEAGLKLVAADTGGFFARTHLFHKRAFEYLSGALAGHYVLFVEQPPLERGSHAIEVKLAAAKGDVLARNTYTAVTTTLPPRRSRGARPARTPDLSCPVTVPVSPPFLPPDGYPQRAPAADSFWHGSTSLWTMLQGDGTWRALPRGEHGFRQKVFLWRAGYNGRVEQWPDVTITGRRLDGDAGPLIAEPATNAYRADFGGWAMLVGVEVPAPGCWAFTASYGGESLAFTVAVVP